MTAHSDGHLGENEANAEGGRWAPIPDHAVLIDGFPHQWCLPERLVEVEGQTFVRCEVHGLIRADHRCGDTPFDHLCLVAAHPNHVVGEDPDDQGMSYADWTDHLLERLHAVRDLHCKDVDARGGTNGCKECGLGWPCPTYHFAIGAGEMFDCWDAGWCSHVGEKVDPATAGLLDYYGTERES